MDSAYDICNELAVAGTECQTEFEEEKESHYFCLFSPPKYVISDFPTKTL